MDVCIAQIPNIRARSQRHEVVKRCCSSLFCSRIFLFVAFRLIVQDRPVEDKVILIAFAEEQILQEAPKIGIVWSVLKAQTTAVVQVRHDLSGEVLAQYLNRSGHLLLHDLFILFLLAVGLESLPWQTATVEVHEHIADGFQIVASALFDAQVRIDTCIACGAGQVLSLSVWDVLLGLRVTILLGQAEIDDVNLVCLLT